MKTNVLSFLEDAVEKYPDRLLFADENTGYTYSEFYRKSRNVASGLKVLFPNVLRKPVIVLIERDVESLLAFFGIVYSGNFYVPVDKNLPVERIQSMITSMGPVAIVYTEKTKECADSLTTDVRKIDLSSLADSILDEKTLSDVRSQCLDTDPLYAIFTSGSTGVPKGVVVAHHSVIDLVDQFTEEFGFDDERIWGNQAPFDFDVSVKDIYSTIRNAGTMYVVPKKLFMMPVKLVEFLNERKVNTIIWAASALIIIANFKTFSKVVPQYLKSVMFSGEVMPCKILNYWRSFLPQINYVNLYGPTEITCNCTFYKIEKQFEDTDVIPIGKPFKNTGILLLDSERKNEVKFGELGEICVTGSSLALGYYNNPEKTAEVFIQNPLNSAYPERIYCTGDLGRYDDNGDLIFSSRRDFQIKHMGHRIEMGEIEVAINALSFIEQAVCLYDTEHNKIVLFYQAEKDYKNEIVSALEKVLPKYMWPNVYKQYEKLPMNKNSKIDRVKLKSEI